MESFLSSSTRLLCMDGTAVFDNVALPGLYNYRDLGPLPVVADQTEFPVLQLHFAEGSCAPSHVYEPVLRLLLRLDKMLDKLYFAYSISYMEAVTMSTKWYRLFGAAIIVIVAGLVGWSIATGNAVVPIPAALGGGVLLYLLKRQAGDVVEDERNYRISEKASRFSIKVFALVTATGGMALTAMSTNDSAPLRAVGLTLAFCACSLLILYVISYAYHSRRS